MLITFMPRLQQLRQALRRHLWRSAISLFVSRCFIRHVPVEVHDSEVLIRAVTTWHVNKKGKLKHGLFKQPDDRVSVSRRKWVDPWLAKLYAKSRIENVQLKPPKRYVGLAFVSARTVRKAGGQVVDSRKEYLGHADIRNGITQVRGEALPPDLSKALDERTQAIVNDATFIRDPKPQNLWWTVSK